MFGSNSFQPTSMTGQNNLQVQELSVDELYLNKQGTPGQVLTLQPDMSLGYSTVESVIAESGSTFDTNRLIINADNTTDTEYMGVLLKYNDGANKYAGLYRDYSTGIIQCFEGLTDPTLASLTGLTLADFKCSDLTCATILCAAGSLDMNNGSLTNVGQINGVTFNSAVVGKITTNENNISTLESSLITLSDTVDGHTSSISTLNSAVSGHTSSIATHAADILTLQLTSATHQTSIINLQGDIGNLETTDSFLESKINANTAALNSGNPSFTTVKFSDGTEALPSMTFASDLTSGMYLPASGHVAITSFEKDVMDLYWNEINIDRKVLLQKGNNCWEFNYDWAANVNYSFDATIVNDDTFNLVEVDVYVQEVYNNSSPNINRHVKARLLYWASTVDCSVISGYNFENRIYVGYVATSGTAGGITIEVSANQSANVCKRSIQIIYRSANSNSYINGSVAVNATAYRADTPAMTAGAVNHFVGGVLSVNEIFFSTPANLCVRGTSSTANTADMVNEHASYTSTVLNLRADRAGSSSYNFIKCTSSDSGTADTEFYVRGDGQVYADGSFNGGGADYAEYMEQLDGGANIPLGTSVVLDSGRIRAWQVGDLLSDCIGVIRSKQGGSVVIGNAYEDYWCGKYLKNDYDEYIMEEKTIWSYWLDGQLVSDYKAAVEANAPRDGESNPIEYKETGTGPAGEVYFDGVKETVQLEKVINPAWDPNLPYVPRSKRPEWYLVGYMGQVTIKHGQPVNPNWRKITDITAGQTERWLIK